MGPVREWGTVWQNYRLDKKSCRGNVIKKSWCTFESPDLLEVLLIYTERSLPVCLWIDKGMTF